MFGLRCNRMGFPETYRAIHLGMKSYDEAIAGATCAQTVDTENPRHTPYKRLYLIPLFLGQRSIQKLP